MTGQGGSFDIEETIDDRPKINATVSTSRDKIDIAAESCRIWNDIRLVIQAPVTTWTTCKAKFSHPPEK